MSLDCGIEQERKIDREVELYRRVVVRRKKERRESKCNTIALKKIYSKADEQICTQRKKNGGL